MERLGFDLGLENGMAESISRVEAVLKRRLDERETSLFELAFAYGSKHGSEKTFIEVKKLITRPRPTTLEKIKNFFRRG